MKTDDGPMKSGVSYRGRAQVEKKDRRSTLKLPAWSCTISRSGFSLATESLVPTRYVCTYTCQANPKPHVCSCRTWAAFFGSQLELCRCKRGYMFWFQEKKNTRLEVVNWNPCGFWQKEDTQMGWIFDEAGCVFHGYRKRRQPFVKNWRLTDNWKIFEFIA